jgi:sugar phosphate isomerase/epimerase
MVRSMMVSTLAGSVICLALVASLFAAPVKEKSAAGQDEKKPAAKATTEKEPQWHLAVQAWTYNQVTLFETIDKCKAVGVKYLEAYPGQKLSPEHKDVGFDDKLAAENRKLVKAKLKKDGIKLVNYGVCNLGDSEKSARKIFDFAKDMGIRTLVAEPGEKMMDVLDKLTEEYKIDVAIHNHPKQHNAHYWNPDTVLAAVKGHSKRIGACADTGHWVRSGLDPVECLKKLDGRIISLHFKDLNEKGENAHDVPYGMGVCDAKAMLAALKRQGFSGVFSIEYEYHQDNPTPEVEQCVKAFHELTKELGAKNVAGK